MGLQIFVDGVEVSEKGDLATVMEAMKELRAARAGLARAGIEGALARCFALEPRLTMVQWRQYTPYFNDGDACVFSAHTDYPTVGWLGEVGEDEAEEGDEEGEWSVDRPWSSRIEPSALQVALAPFWELAELGDEIFLDAYGDHTEVTVRLVDGELVVETDGCDHD